MYREHTTSNPFYCLLQNFTKWAFIGMCSSIRRCVYSNLYQRIDEILHSLNGNQSYHFYNLLLARAHMHVHTLHAGSSVQHTQHACTQLSYWYCTCSMDVCTIFFVQPISLVIDNRAHSNKIVLRRLKILIRVVLFMTWLFISMHTLICVLVEHKIYIDLNNAVNWLIHNTHSYTFFNSL